MAARRCVILALVVAALAAGFAAHPEMAWSLHEVGAVLWGWVIIALVVMALLAVGLYAFRRLR